MANGVQPYEETELWWQRLNEQNGKRTYFRRRVAATAAEAARHVEADFREWGEGQRETLEE